MFIEKCLLARYVRSIPTYLRDSVGEEQESSYYQLNSAVLYTAVSMLLYEIIPDEEKLRMSKLIIELAAQFQDMRTLKMAVSDVEEFRNLSLDIANRLISSVENIT